MYYIFAFRSRTQAMRFYDCIRTKGVQCAVVNTPRKIAVGCGLSVKVWDRIEIAKSNLDISQYTTFLGAYYVDYNRIERVSV